MDPMEISRRADAAANKLTKWRSVFAGWQLGTRSMDDGESNAVRDHREVTMLLRAEMNGLTRILLDKGIVTPEEFTSVMVEEYLHLDKQFEERFPGFRSEQSGMTMTMPEAGETMKRLHFPS